jgi:hypothetical protein
MRDIHITKVTNGIVVIVGCASFVFNNEDLAYAFQRMREYVENPDAVERDVMEKYPSLFPENRTLAQEPIGTAQETVRFRKYAPLEPVGATIAKGAAIFSDPKL